MSDDPIICRFTDGALVPSTNYQRHLAFERWQEGQLVPVVEHSQRSDKSHDHYFATLNDMWASLPEDVSPDFPNVDVLRAHALIRTGYANKRQLVSRSNAEAERVAAFMRPASPLAIIAVDGCVVTEWTAESQKYRAMGKQRFQESKDAVLEYVTGLLERKAEAA